MATTTCVSRWRPFPSFETPLRSIIVSEKKNLNTVKSWTRIQPWSFAATDINDLASVSVCLIVFYVLSDWANMHVLYIHKRFYVAFHGNHCAPHSLLDWLLGVVCLDKVYADYIPNCSLQFEAYTLCKAVSALIQLPRKFRSLCAASFHWHSLACF